MMYAYSGTFAIEDPSITLFRWRGVLLDPKWRSEAAGCDIFSDGANPVEWTIEADSIPFAMIMIMPWYSWVWEPNTEKEDGLFFIVDTPDLPFVYLITAITGSGNTGATMPEWPTTPGDEVTHGDCTYQCVGRWVQPQIEGLVWGTPI